MNTQIRECKCVGVLVFMAGSGMRTTRPMVSVPYNTQNRGAEFQDATYGKGMRVHNVGKKVASCTVCGLVKGL